MPLPHYRLPAIIDPPFPHHWLPAITDPPLPHHRSTNTQDPPLWLPTMHRWDRLSSDLDNWLQAMDCRHHPRPISSLSLKIVAATAEDRSLFPSITQSFCLWSPIFFFFFFGGGVGGGVLVVFMFCGGGFCVDSGGFSMGAGVWVLMGFVWIVVDFL